MSKHTPGPWVLGDGTVEHAHNIYPEYDQRQGQAIASMEPNRRGARAADARLIAAAPDLLMALERIERIATEEDIAELSPEMYHAVMQARAVIARARGES